MQHQPLSSSECFLYVENSPPPTPTSEPPLLRTGASPVYFPSFVPHFLKKWRRNTFEDKISVDDRNFIFPVF